MMPNAQRGRVLVVDDDPDVLDLMARQVLQPLGYLVQTADDGGAAIQHALNFAPDLIVASLTLPGLSGKDLLVALRSQGMEVPMLVTAPEGMEAAAIQAFRLGRATTWSSRCARPKSSRPSSGRWARYGCATSGTCWPSSWAKATASSSAGCAS